MSDLLERMGDLDRVPAPDLRSRIAANEGMPAHPEPRFRTKLTVVVAAVVVCVLAGILLWRVFGGWFEPRTAPASNVPSVPAHSNGKIYFYVGAQGGTWVSVSQKGTREPLPSSFGNGYVSQVSFSPDGTKMAYQGIGVVGGQRVFGIFVAAADGSGAHMLASGANYGWPSWSPSGREIVFSGSSGSPSLTVACSSDSQCPTDIYVMNSDGTNLRRLTSGPTGEYQPAFSPDGSQIAFAKSTGNALDQSIWVMDANGEGARPLVSGGVGSNGRLFSFSPVADEIAFVRDTPTSWEIAETSVRSGGMKVLFSEQNVWSENPLFSPDGSKIAFSSTAGAYPPGCGFDSDVCADLYVIGADGSGLTRLTKSAQGATDIAWQSARPAFNESPPGLAVCSLISPASVAAAVGGRVTSVRTLGPSDFKTGQGPPTCEYATNTRYGDIIVSTKQGAGAIRRQYRSPDPNMQRVANLGQAAVFFGCGDLSVLQNGVSLSVSFQYADCNGLPVLRKLAEEALGSLALPAAPRSPSPLPTLAPSSAAALHGAAPFGPGVMGSISSTGGPVPGITSDHLSGNVRVLAADGSVVASTHVPKGGTFQIDLPPGAYRVQAEPSASTTWWCSAPATVSTGFTHVTIVCKAT